jgi:hypothetical protein
MNTGYVTVLVDFFYFLLQFTWCREQFHWFLLINLIKKNLIVKYHHSIPTTKFQWVILFIFTNFLVLLSLPNWVDLLHIPTTLKIHGKKTQNLSPFYCKFMNSISLISGRHVSMEDSIAFLNEILCVHLRYVI